MSQCCAQWRGDLGAYVLGALDPRERTAVRRHLAACEACRAVYADLVPVRDWLARAKLHLAACPSCGAAFAELLEERS